MSDLCILCGYVPSTNNSKKLRKYLLQDNLDFSHFSPQAKNKARAKYQNISKVCPICKASFFTKKNHRLEKTYCSKLCANQESRGNRHTPRTNAKTSATLMGRIGHTKLKRVKKIKYCAWCLSEIKGVGEKYCSNTCASREKHKSPEYRKKLSIAAKKRVAEGRHVGWASRNILSYPEKFFVEVLQNHELLGKVKINFPVKKTQLGLEGACQFFLDFYFPELKLDLEIDGKQHQYPERMASDLVRDAALTKHGYIVYRIKWKNPHKHSEYIKNEINKFLKFYKELADRK